MKPIKIIECPRDALQGITKRIETKHKLSYYQSLLKVGFDTLDCGSFVSPRMVPQMADTGQVIAGLDCSDSPTKLLTIIANERGAQEAVKFSKITYLGYPFSVSENFQVRNTGKTIDESLLVLEKIKNLVFKNDKKLVVYLSMGFGNPYGDPWSPEYIKLWVRRLVNMGIDVISLSDTIGSAKPKDITYLFQTLLKTYTEIEFGAHFHTRPEDWFKKVDAAFLGGCHRFDGALRGWGGCPMAQDELVGNMPTEKLISYFTQKHMLPKSMDVLAFESAYNHSHKIFV